VIARARMHLLRARGCVTFALTLWASLAAAQAVDPGAPPRPSLAESLSGAARQAYEAAMLLFNNHDCARALEKYRQAYALSKDSRLLFDMAVCERDLRSYARMQTLLLRYEKEEDARLSPAQRADIDAALAAIHNLVGTVRLTVNEGGASVSLDGELVGTTPLDATLDVDLGRHTLVVAKSGFQTAEQTIEIAGGNEASVGVTLSARMPTGQVHIVAGPGATIVLDSKDATRDRFDGALPAGSHDLEVTAPGKRPYRTRLDLGDGDNRTLDVTLQDDRRAPIWPWLVGGAAVVAGGAVGGYFLLRPQTERGAPPQGALGHVTIGGGPGQ
jgi:hypothetical protein